MLGVFMVGDWTVYGKQQGNSLYQEVIIHSFNCLNNANDFAGFLLEKTFTVCILPRDKPSFSGEFSEFEKEFFAGLI